MEQPADRLLACIASGLIGLVIGSFLNVVVYRLPRGESIAAPPSHCPACDTRLGPLENVPVVSWLVLRGHCRHCGAPISARYPLVELLCALAFVLVALAFSGFSPLAPLDAVLAITVAAGAIDLDRMAVPPVLDAAVLTAAATLVAVSLATSADGRLGWAAVVGGAAVAPWLLALAVSRDDGHPARVPGVALWVAWGWTAGWTGEGVGLAVPFVALAATALNAVASRHTRLRGLPLTFACAACSAVAIVAGAYARP